MSSKTSKPPKPRPDFPLFAHGNGQWCRKVRGRFHYFGPWSDPNAALANWLAGQEDLEAGRPPRQPGDDSPTLDFAIGRFLFEKQSEQTEGEIRLRTFLDYRKTCRRIADSLGKPLPMNAIRKGDLLQLKADLKKGKNGKRGLVTLKNDLTRAKTFFRFVNEELELEKPIRYHSALKPPKQKHIRKESADRGKREFKPAEIADMLSAAGPQLRAMIYLGINCGFGNHDCGSLPIGKLDLAGGWHNFARPKTSNERRCPLWPETVEALHEALAVRPCPASPEVKELVFLTWEGACWSKEKGDNALSSEFRKLMKSLGMYRKNVTTFYTLRRTFETIAAETGKQVAIDHIMGHIAPTSDMASVYRQRVFDRPLQEVTSHVRDWLLG